ncbi:MAG: DNA polymerase I [Myxococcales bacterium]|nr:DNA polymerase I [Myxococcales bacterium]
MGDKLFVVDGSGYLYRAFHSMRDLQSDAESPTNVVFGFALLMRNLLRRETPSHLAVVFDAVGESFRHRLFSGYKAHREATPEELRRQIPDVLELLDCYRIATLTEPDVEADDVIATLAVTIRPPQTEMVIVSADKDLMQLVGPQVSMWDTMRDRRYSDADVRARFGVAPNQMVDYLALCGDASDNVPGVKGIGAKTASSLLQQFPNLEAIYRGLGSIERARTRELLRTSEADARLSRALVSLRTAVPLDRQLDDFRYRGPDTPRLAAFLRRLHFFTMARDVEREAGGSSAMASLDVGPNRTPARARVPAPAASPTTTSEVTLEICRNLHDIPRQLAALGTTRQLALTAWLGGAGAGRGSQRSGLIGIALGTRERVVYLPCGHHYLGAAQQPAADDLLRSLARALDEGGFELFTHDSKALWHLFHATDATCPRIACDLMLGSYLDDPEQPHTLAAIAERAGLGPITPPEQSRGDLPIEQIADEAARLVPRVHLLAARQHSALERTEQLSLMASLELPLAALLARIEARGIAVDREMLDQLGDDFAERIRVLEAEIHRLAGRPFNILSPQQLGHVLFGTLGLPAKKKGRSGFSTDHEVLAELAQSHRLPALVLDYRQLTKLKSTYTDGLTRLLNPQTGRIHTHFNQAVTATGRLSSTAPNLQNIPIRTELGVAIRGAFVAPQGFELLSADYSQIELRILAHLSGDPALCQAFRDGADVHVQTASEVFGRALGEVTPSQRRVAKALNFGIMYGMGANRLAREIDVSRREATQYIRRYFERYAKVRELLDHFVVEAKACGFATTLLNRRRYLPGLADPNRGVRSAAERAAINTPIQGSAADIIKLAMLRVDERLRREQLSAAIVLQVHDELVFEVEYAALERTRALVAEEMEGVMTLDVPLVVDLASGRSWRDAK